MKPAVFLDRDGVINAGGNINRPEQFRLLDGAAAAIVQLKVAGYTIVVVTNQGGLGEGYDGRRLWAKAPMTRNDLGAVHTEMLRQLGPAAAPDVIKVCPHATFLKCACRKPNPGMIVAAAGELGLDLSASYLVGDRESDLQAGLAAGVTPILVLTGDGHQTAQTWAGPGQVVPTLAAAATFILASAQH